MPGPSHDAIEVRSGSLVLTVAPGACGAITRFAHENGARSLELLRPALAGAVAARRATDMSCFPLVPFANRIAHGRFRFRGRDVALPPNFPPEPHAIHGHGWQSAWTVAERAAAGLTLELRHPADAWPFPYRTRQRFTLTDDRLEVALSVINEGDEPMPAGLGLHPYFVRTPGARVRAHVEGMWKTDDAALPTGLVPVPPDVPLRDGLEVDQVVLDTNFSGFAGVAEIRWPELGAGLRIETGAPFGFVQVFTPAAQPFFCVEPVSNGIDAFNLAGAGRADTGTLVLAPGEEATGTVRFVPDLGARS